MQYIRCTLVAIHKFKMAMLGIVTVVLTWSPALQINYVVCTLNSVLMFLYPVFSCGEPLGG